MHREVEVRGNLIFRQSLKIDREKTLYILVHRKHARTLNNWCWDLKSPKVKILPIIIPSKWVPSKWKRATNPTSGWRIPIMLAVIVQIQNNQLSLRTVNLSSKLMTWFAFRGCEERLNVNTTNDGVESILSWNLAVSNKVYRFTNYRHRRSHRGGSGGTSPPTFRYGGARVCLCPPT